MAVVRSVLGLYSSGTVWKIKLAANAVSTVSVPSALGYPLTGSTLSFPVVGLTGWCVPTDSFLSMPAMIRTVSSGNWRTAGYQRAYFMSEGSAGCVAVGPTYRLNG